MKAIPVGRNEAGLLYFVVDGPSTGAVMQKNKKVVNVDFLSYITTKPVERINDTSFHRFLWNGVDSPDNKWKNIIQYQVQPIPEHMLVSVESLSSFPKPTAQRKASMNEKDDRATEFKSLLASGNHEKALGRALRRGARRVATGGVRGFVRGARFNPNAEDADGDGFVQEGTQFARRVSSTVTPKRRRPKRVNRASQRADILDVVGMRSRRDWIENPDQRRWIQRSKDHYRNIYADQNKKVFDAFSNGREIKTYADMERALRVAFPRFAAGTTDIDYIRGANPDAELDPTHFEHAMGMMIAVLANPLLAEVDFEVAEGKTLKAKGSADGYTAYLGRHRVKLDNGKVVLVAGPDKRMKLQLMYRDRGELSYDRSINLEDFGNFQLETHKMFFTMLHDVPPPVIKGPSDPLSQLLGVTAVRNPDYDEKAEALWEEAKRMAARSVTLHEMGHASNIVMAQRDSMLAEGLDFTDDLSIQTIEKRIKDSIDSMSAEEAIAAIREAKLRKVTHEFFATLAQMTLRANTGDKKDEAVFDEVANMELTSADGQGRITVGKELADYLNAAGRRVFPNPTGSRWKPDDPVTFWLIFMMFNDDELAVSGRDGVKRSIYADTRMPYRNLNPWNGRTAAEREVILSNGYGQEQKGVIPQAGLIAELGLPEAAGLPAVSPGGMQPIIEAMARLTLAFDGDNYQRNRLQEEITFGQAKNSFANVVSGTLGPDVARSEIFSEIMALLKEQIEEYKTNPNRDRGALIRRLMEQFFSGGKLFDDLSPEERVLARQIARQAAGGPWYSYMTHLYEGNEAGYLGFKDSELLAELVAANFLGNELEIMGDDGKRPLNPKETAVLKKLINWLFPNADFKIG